jgi:DNA-binding CsgD family transcriptional regulator
VPTAIWSAVAGLRADLAAPASSLLATTRVGPVRIEASPAGPDGATAVIVEPARRAALELPGAWPLSPAERQVIERAVLGLSNRRISEALSIAEHTVEWHLSRAYDKLGIRGRGDLLARFFREVYLHDFAAEAAATPSAAA